jgi:hypothetical protein
MLTLSALPGLTDVPDAALAAGNVCLDTLLTKISQSAKFGCVRPEFFYNDCLDGDTLLPPISPADGYVYSPSELMYIWALRFGYNYKSCKPSAKGQLLLESTNVDQATGKVSILKAYYVQGGQQTNTNDGILAVWTIAIRGGVQGNNLLSMSAQPAFTDIADSCFAQDVPVKQTNIRQLKANAQRAAVSTEPFCNFGGALVSVAVAAGGSGYQLNDILTLVQSSASGGKVKVTSVASGGGQIQMIGLGTPGSGYPGSGYAVNDILTVIESGASGGQVQVTATDGSNGGGKGKITGLAIYAQGSGYTGLTYNLATSGGSGSGATINVLAVGGLGVVTGVSIYADPVTGSQGQLYIKGNSVQTTGGTGSGCTLNITAVTASGYSNGSTVPLPISLVDGYTYSYSELNYFPFWMYTGKSDRSGPSGAGRVRLKTLGVSAGAGCTVNILNVSGGAITSVAVNAGGTGYKVGDLLNVVQGGASGGQVQVTSISGGGVTGPVTGLSVFAGGSGYSTANGLATTGGIVSCGVHYWDGNTDTPTNDGIIGVLVLATRQMPVLGATAGNYVDIDDYHLWALQLLGDSYLLEVSHNAKFANLRPEVFTGIYHNGDTVPLPTSPSDSYAYARAELQYLYSVANSGGVPDGDILAETNYVDPLTGAVSVATQLQTSDGNLYNGQTPGLYVVTIARRAHETGDITWAAVGSPQQTAAPPPPEWVQCMGVNGIFHFCLAPGAKTAIDQLLYQIQLADDLAFSQNVETLDLGSDPIKTWREPNRVRYCRARAAFTDSPWSAWTLFGTPVPMLSQVAGGSLPARTYYVQIQYYSTTGGLFRVSVAAKGSGYVVGDLLGVVQSGATGGALTVAAVNASGGVTAVSIFSIGAGYSVASGVSTSGGSGTGCTINILKIIIGGIICSPSAEVSIALSANYLLKVSAPANPPFWGDPGINTTRQYGIFASQTQGGETLQASPTIPNGWTEPTSGLTNTGSTPFTATTDPAVGSGNVSDNVSDYLIHQGVAPSGSGYSYRQISPALGYAVQPGDFLEFDQYVDAASAGATAGIDFQYGPTGVEYLADASSLVDQNGLSIAPSTDLSSYASGSWYHRKFDLTSLVGYLIGSVASALTGSGSASYKGRLANISVTNGGLVSLPIYSSGAPNDGSIWTPGGETFTSVGLKAVESPFSVQVAGLVPFTSPAAEKFSVPHNLGHTPNGVLAPVLQTGGAVWFQNPAFDATYIYLVASAPGIVGAIPVV